MKFTIKALLAVAFSTVISSLSVLSTLTTPTQSKSKSCLTIKPQPIVERKPEPIARDTHPAIETRVEKKAVQTVEQKVTVEIGASYVISRETQVSPKKLDEKLKGVLKGKGSVIVSEAKKNHVCPLVLTAILIHESGNGSSAAARQKNNVAGIYDGKRKCNKSFDSVNDCIAYTAKLLGSSYNGQTLSSVQKRYCPVGAKNDPKGLNGQWLAGIVKTMRAFVKA